MPSKIESESSGLSRRSVLRRGAFVAATATVGIGALSAPAAAHACPRTPGYWKNHDWPSSGLENVNTRMEALGLGPNYFDSVEEGQEFLSQPKRGDKGLIMAFHLIAFILNNQVACEDDLSKPVADVTDAAGYDGEETILDIKALAQDWLEESNFDGPQETWFVSSAIVEDGEVLKDYLDAYNNAQLFDCSCGDGD